MSLRWSAVLLAAASAFAAEYKASYDGRVVYFTGALADDLGPSRLWRWANGTIQSLLDAYTPNLTPSSIRLLRLSPDGRFALAHTSRFSPDQSVNRWHIFLDGSPRPLVEITDAQLVSMSPNGRWVVVYRYQAGRAVELFELSETGLRSAAVWPNPTPKRRAPYPHPQPPCHDLRRCSGPCKLRHFSHRMPMGQPLRHHRARTHSLRRNRSHVLFLARPFPLHPPRLLRPCHPRGTRPPRRVHPPLHHWHRSSRLRHGPAELFRCRRASNKCQVRCPIAGNKAPRRRPPTHHLLPLPPTPHPRIAPKHELLFRPHTNAHTHSPITQKGRRRNIRLRPCLVLG